MVGDMLGELLCQVVTKPAAVKEATQWYLWNPLIDLGVQPQ